MAKKKVIKLDIGRMEDLTRFKAIVDSGVLLEWEQWCSVNWNVYGGLNEDDVLRLWGKGECQSNDRDYDFEGESKYKTQAEMEDHQAMRGAENLCQNEFDKWGDYTRKNIPLDSDLKESFKDAIRAAGGE